MTNKYRPSLTNDEILRIIELAKKEVPLKSVDVSIIATLAPYQFKIQNDTVASAYSVKKPDNNILKSIGGNPETAISNLYNGFNTKEEYWAHCHAKYILTPSDCSLAETLGAHEHMYLNGLMSEEERIAFENKDIK